MLTRGMLPNSKGAVHWSIGSLLKYPSISKGIINGPYKKEALRPASPWLSNKTPKTPELQIHSEGENFKIAWEASGAEEVSNWVLYYKYDSSWEYKILSRSASEIEIAKLLIEKGKKNPLIAVGVTAISKTGIESDFVEIKIDESIPKYEF